MGVMPWLFKRSGKTRSLHTPLPLARQKSRQGRGSCAPVPLDQGVRSSPYCPPHEIPHAYLFRSHAYSQPSRRRTQIVMGARDALERLALEPDLGGELVQLLHGLVADHVAPLARPVPPYRVHQDHVSSSCGLWLCRWDSLRRAGASRDGLEGSREGIL